MKLCILWYIYAPYDLYMKPLWYLMLADLLTCITIVNYCVYHTTIALSVEILKQSEINWNTDDWYICICVFYLVWYTNKANISNAL